MIMSANSTNSRPEWSVLTNRVLRAKEQARTDSPDSPATWEATMRLGELHVPVAPEFNIRDIMPADDHRRLRRCVQVATDRGFTMRQPFRVGGAIFTVRIEPTEDGRVNTYWSCT